MLASARLRKVVKARVARWLKMMSASFMKLKHKHKNQKWNKISSMWWGRMGDVFLFFPFFIGGEFSLTWKKRWLFIVMLQNSSIWSGQELGILQSDRHTPSESNKVFQPPWIKSYERLTAVSTVKDSFTQDLFFSLLFKLVRRCRYPGENVLVWIKITAFILIFFWKTIAFLSSNFFFKCEAVRFTPV